MIDFTRKDRYAYEDLVLLVRLLRGPGGCPWDREQTHESVLRNFQEETYEFCEAAMADDRDHMCEELGDVLMQVVFHACIEEERGRMTMEDVCDAVCKKLVFRHPHVFGAVKCRDSAEVLTTWDQVKRVEKGQKTVTDTLNSVAKNLPALWRGEKILHKAAKSGFCWDSVSGALAKLEEEVRELRAAVEAGCGQEEELGDALLSLCAVASMLELDPEQALHRACEKFIARFALVEQSAGEQDLAALTKAKLEELWTLAKLRLRTVQNKTKEKT
ncbi:MAG: nucleoside triphosphate pyrophosphohydrolase [Oscillospiraceae bacterium]|nr:nucleoside triphosphate pyrophosphohydrolase [Oscillospiraceae bacterium]